MVPLIPIARANPAAPARLVTGRRDVVVTLQRTEVTASSAHLHQKINTTPALAVYETHAPLVIARTKSAPLVSTVGAVVETLSVPAWLVILQSKAGTIVEMVVSFLPADGASATQQGVASVSTCEAAEDVPTQATKAFASRAHIPGSTTTSPPMAETRTLVLTRAARICQVAQSESTGKVVEVGEIQLASVTVHHVPTERMANTSVVMAAWTTHAKN
mmetsp:Transcript_2422/g.4460  ORF Transcript_2422/g.4460 Transcript_2422/m.4460 type:complete len:217 (+) Transcript_2422:2744-3394(+)